MNHIAFDLRLLKASADGTDSQNCYALDIRVDDRNLLEYVRDTERPFATAEGHPNLAGQYEALPASMALEHLATKGNAKVSLYDCECGCYGCWPLLVRISAAGGIVTWSEFEQPHRGVNSGASWWRYDRLGPFQFDRSQYEAAWRKAESELRSHLV
jgi:hypothetical protein